MFVWVFHRISGLLLIVLLAVQLVSGFVQAAATDQEIVRKYAVLHRHAPVVCLTVILLVFHALYGIRTMLIDLGVRRERLLFWVCTATGFVLCGVFLALYLTLIPR